MRYERQADPIWPDGEVTAKIFGVRIDQGFIVFELVPLGLCAHYPLLPIRVGTGPGFRKLMMDVLAAAGQWKDEYSRVGNVNINPALLEGEVVTLKLKSGRIYWNKRKD